MYQEPFRTQTNAQPGPLEAYQSLEVDRNSEETHYQPQSTSIVSTAAAPVVPASKSKKSQRIVHPAFEFLGACDSCRTRRVKCIRLHADDPTCEYCRDRALDCKNKRNGGIRYKPRVSKKANVPEQSRKLSTNSARPTASNSSHDVSPTSVENRLSLIEESETLMGQLMDCSLESFLGSSYMWSHLRVSFENAGRRPNMLDPISEIVAMACMALGALQSDHPLIIGSNSPHRHNLSAVGATEDLSNFARRRAPLCQQLADRVIAMVDFRGLFRKATVESLTTLILAQRVVTHLAGEENDTIRPYLSANINLVQQLRETGTANDVLLNPPSFFIWCQDSARSALKGTSFQMYIVYPITTLHFLRLMLFASSPEADVEEFLNPTRPMIPELTMDYLQTIPDALSLDINLYAGPIITFWFSAVKPVRPFAAEISIPMRKKETVKASDFARHLTAAESLFEIFRGASEVARQLKPRLSPEAIDIQTKTMGSPALLFVEDAPLLTCPFLLVFALKFKTWSLERSVFSSADSGWIEQLAEIAAIRQHLSRMMVDAVLLVKESLERIKDLFHWPTHLNWHGVQYHLGAWANVALSTDCAEEGGPFKYTGFVKLAACRRLIDAVRVQSWIWERRRDEVVHLEQRYQQTVLDVTNVMAATYPGPAHASDPLVYLPHAGSAFATTFHDDPNISTLSLQPYTPYPAPNRCDGTTYTAFSFSGDTSFVPPAEAQQHAEAMTWTNGGRYGAPG